MKGSTLFSIFKNIQVNMCWEPVLVPLHYGGWPVTFLNDVPQGNQAVNFQKFPEVSRLLPTLLVVSF